MLSCVDLPTGRMTGVCHYRTAKTQLPRHTNRDSTECRIYAWIAFRFDTHSGLVLGRSPYLDLSVRLANVRQSAASL
jgi:hypothetical protein